MLNLLVLEDCVFWLAMAHKPVPWVKIENDLYVGNGVFWLSSGSSSRRLRPEWT